MPLGTAAACRRADRAGAELGRRGRQRRHAGRGARDDCRRTSRSSIRSLPWSPRWRFRPTARSLAVSGNREILIHALDGSAPPKRLPGLSERILSLAFSKDGTLLLAGGGTPARFGEIQFWELPAGKLRRSVMLTGDTVFGASLSPDGTRVAVGMHGQHCPHHRHRHRQRALQDGRARKLGARHGLRRGRQAHRLGRPRPRRQAHRRAIGRLSSKT